METNPRIKRTKFGESMGRIKEALNCRPNNTDDIKKSGLMSAEKAMYVFAGSKNDGIVE